MRVVKLIRKDIIYEQGDFFGGDGENDVIRSIEMTDHEFHIITNHTHTTAVQLGDWVKFEDGTSMMFDEEDEDEEELS